MAKKLKLGGAAKSAAQSAIDMNLAKNVMDSAQSIWLAGLGAFSNVQAEGGKVFEQLVEVGKGIESRTRAVADKAVGAVSDTVKSTAGDAVAKAQGQWDKLEQVFEDRVSKSLHRLGVLTNKDIEALTVQVADLSDAVRKLTATPAKAAKATPAKPKASAKVGAAAKPAAAKKVVKAPAKKAAAKKAPAKSTVEKMSAAASGMAKAVAKQPAVKRARKLVKDITGQD